MLKIRINTVTKYIVTRIKAPGKVDEGIRGVTMIFHFLGTGTPALPAQRITNSE